MKNISRAIGQNITRTIAKSSYENLLNGLDGGTLLGKPTGGSGDFDVDYTSMNTLTASNLPATLAALYAEDITAIIQYDTNGNLVHVFTRDSNNISMTGLVISVGGAKFEATDTFIVITNI